MDYILLTTKPQLILYNMSLEDYEQNDQANKNIQNKQILEQQYDLYSYSVEYLQLYEEQKQINEILEKGFELLGLISYFTVGKDEVKQWMIKKGTQAPRAAREIHTEFEKGFLSAEVIDYQTFAKTVEDQGINKLKNKYRKEGKEYTVVDGDIITFQCKIK